MTKYLTVYDDADHTLNALDPKNATAIGLPAFAIGNALPAAGQVVGEGFLVSPTKTGYLWDGTRWVAIVPSALLNYATDALVLADGSQSPGSYATSQATGNLFISMAGGAWHQVGVRSYATETAMKNDLNAVEGDTAWTQDTNQLWYFNAGKWFTLGVHYYATEAALIADQANNAGGAVACAMDTGLLFSCPTQLPALWQPMSIAQFATEAAMRAKTTDNVAHQVAITQDTHRIYVWNGTRWTGSPTEYFATEAALLAATADAGTLGIAGDTAKAYIRTSTGWNPLAGPTMTAGIALPTTGMATGDMFYNITTKTLYVRGGSTWDAVSGGATVSATAPATPQTGQLWYDTTATVKELKTWDGTAWVTAYDQIKRVGDGHIIIESGTQTQLELQSHGGGQNTGIKLRSSAGPAFWWETNAGPYDDFMQVAADGVVTFPHTAIPRLVGKQAINHHKYGASVWEETYHTITGIQNYVPLGNMYKIEVDLRGRTFHSAKLYMQTKWIGVTGNGYLRLEAGVEDTTQIGVTRTLTGICANANIQLEILTYGEGGGNGDREVIGNMLVWDLGPPGNIRDIT